MASIQPFQMNVYHSNTYRNYLSWLHFHSEPQDQERQQVKDQQSCISIVVAYLTLTQKLLLSQKLAIASEISNPLEPPTPQPSHLQGNREKNSTNINRPNPAPVLCCFQCLRNTPAYLQHYSRLFPIKAERLSKDLKNN